MEEDEDEEEEERRVNRRNEKQENKQNASLAAADVTYQADTTCATHTHAHPKNTEQRGGRSQSLLFP